MSASEIIIKGNLLLFEILYWIQQCHLNEKELNKLGGLMSLEQSLETNFVSGISGSERYV
jgi:hypothetical protein